MTLTGRDGDATAVLLDEIRGHIAEGTEHLKRRRLVMALEAAHHAELRSNEIEELISEAGSSLHAQSFRMLKTELKLLNQRIHLAIG